MANAAVNFLGHVDAGIVVTKYGHIMGEIPGVSCREAGHPIPDQNSFDATEAAIGLVSGLTAEDSVLFLLSGGGSALFEKPLISGDELQDITRQLLGCGADIVEMNTIRKRLSGVKGGRFAALCAPARVFSIVLSDIIGDPPDMIASGPAAPDRSTCQDALRIMDKYGIALSEPAKILLCQETPKELPNVQTIITGSVRELCSRLYLDSGTLTPLLKKMEKDGLVTRRRSDEDERVTLIRITDQGMALREAAAEIPSQVGGCLKLPAEDALNLYHTMYKLLGEFS